MTETRGTNDLDQPLSLTRNLASTSMNATEPNRPTVQYDKGIDWNFHIRYRETMLSEKDFPNYLLLPEVNRLIDTMRNEHQAKADFIWRTGARIGEVQNVKKQSITLYEEGGEQRAIVTLRTAKQRGKPRTTDIDRTRDIPIRDHEYALTLKRRLDNLPGRIRTTPLFTPCSRQAFDKALKNATNALGLLPISAHNLRHSFACNLALHRRDVFFIQRMLGHKRIETTLIYMQLLDVDMAFLMDGVRYR